MSRGKPQQRARVGKAKPSAKKPWWRKPMVWLGGAATTITTGVLSSLLVNLLSAQSQQVIAQPSWTPSTPASMHSNIFRSSPRRIASPSPPPFTGDPLTVVSEDPINLDDAGVWVFPRKVVFTPNQLKILNTYPPGMATPPFMNLLFSLGAYQAHPDTQLVLQNNRAQEIRVLNMNVVKSCQAPLTGTLIFSPNGGADPTIQLGFNLDSADTEAETVDAADNFTVQKPDYFAGHTVTIQPGAQQVFNIKTVTSKQSCSFRFLFSLLVGSRKAYQLIGDGSQPFRISALIGTGPAVVHFADYSMVYAGGLASPAGNNDRFVPVNPKTYKY